MGIVKLVREGVIASKYKKVYPGKAVAVGEGTAEDVGSIRGTPMFELYDGDYVLDSRIVCQFEAVLEKKAKKLYWP